MNYWLRARNTTKNFANSETRARNPSNIGSKDEHLEFRDFSETKVCIQLDLT